MHNTAKQHPRQKILYLPTIQIIPVGLQSAPKQRPKAETPISLPTTQITPASLYALLRDKDMTWSSWCINKANNISYQHQSTSNAFLDASSVRRLVGPFVHLYHFRKDHYKSVFFNELMQAWTIHGLPLPPPFLQDESYPISHYPLSPLPMNHTFMPSFNHAIL